MERFKCTYDKCNRELMANKDRPFPCSACGHGTMTPMKPKAYCRECGKPIYENVDTMVPSKWHKPDSIETEGIDVICDDCMKSPALKKSGKYAQDYPDPYLAVEPEAIIDCDNCRHDCKQPSGAEVVVCPDYEEKEGASKKTPQFKEEQEERSEKLLDRYLIVDISGIDVDIRKFREDKVYFVKKAYEILNKPNAGSLQWRINLVACLENVLKTQFANSRDLNKKVTGYLKRVKKGKVKRDAKTMREMQSIMKTPGQRIEKARKKLKWTQERLADHLGFKSKGTIANYEKDERYPPEKVFEWLEEVEGLSRKEVQRWAKKKAQRQVQECQQQEVRAA